jgi:hypothetical protein
MKTKREFGRKLRSFMNVASKRAQVVISFALVGFIPGYRHPVPNMAVFCSSLTSSFPGMLLTYFLNDFEMVIRWQAQLSSGGKVSSLYSGTSQAYCRSTAVVTATAVRARDLSVLRNVQPDSTVPIQRVSGAVLPEVKRPVG